MLHVHHATHVLLGTKRALKRRAWKRRALKKHTPMGKYTYILNMTTSMDLARGTYSSVHVLISACLIPSECLSLPLRVTDVNVIYIYIYREREISIIFNDTRL